MEESTNKDKIVFVGKQDVYTVEQLALKLNVKERTIADALRSGKLKGYKKFRRWYVLHDDLMNFLTTEELESDPESEKS